MLRSCCGAGFCRSGIRRLRSYLRIRCKSQIKCGRLNRIHVQPSAKAGSANDRLCSICRYAAWGIAIAALCFAVGAIAAWQHVMRLTATRVCTGPEGAATLAFVCLFLPSGRQFYPFGPSSDTIQARSRSVANVISLQQLMSKPAWSPNSPTSSPDSTW